MESRNRCEANSICLGILRIDSSYPPARGDIACPNTFGYVVHYKTVVGLTFEICQSGVLTPEVEANFISAIRYLDETKEVDGFSADCGFMMNFQDLARTHTNKPVFLSSLVSIPTVLCAYNKDE